VNEVVELKLWHLFVIAFVAFLVFVEIAAAILQYDAYLRCMDGLSRIPLDSPWLHIMADTCADTKPWWL